MPYLVEARKLLSRIVNQKWSWYIKVPLLPYLLMFIYYICVPILIYVSILYLYTLAIGTHAPHAFLFTAYHDEPHRSIHPIYMVRQSW